MNKKLNVALQNKSIFKRKSKPLKFIAHSYLFREKYSSVLTSFDSKEQEVKLKKSLRSSLTLQKSYQSNSKKWITLKYLSPLNLSKPNLEVFYFLKKEPQSSTIPLQDVDSLKSNKIIENEEIFSSAKPNHGLSSSSLDKMNGFNETDKNKFYTSYSKKNEIKYISIGLASPQKIRKWAEKSLPNGKMVGQVLNANTLHHKTLKPQKGGLFCERIFGPLKDFFCGCGKSSKITMANKNKVNKKNSPYLALLSQIHSDSSEGDLQGFQSSQKPLMVGGSGKFISNKFCPDCDIEYTWSVVRRYQLGFIELTLPVTHVWYLKGIPNNYMSVLLGIKRRYLQSIAYCSEKITLENGFNKIEIERTPDELFASWQKLIQKSTQNSEISNQISESSFLQKEKFLSASVGSEETQKRLNSLNLAKPSLAEPSNKAKFKKLLALKKKRQNLKIIKRVNSIKILDLYFKSFGSKKTNLNLEIEKNWILTNYFNYFQPFLNNFPIHSYILKNLEISSQQESLYLSNKLFNFFYKNNEIKRYWFKLCTNFPEPSNRFGLNSKISQFKKNWLIAFEILYKKTSHFNYQRYLLSRLEPSEFGNFQNYPFFLDDKRSFAFQKNCHEFLTNQSSKNKFLKNYPKNWFPTSHLLHQKRFLSLHSFKTNQMTPLNTLKKKGFQSFSSIFSVAGNSFVQNSKSYSSFISEKFDFAKPSLEAERNFDGIWFFVTKQTLLNPLKSAKQKERIHNLNQKTFDFLFSLIHLTFSATLGFAKLSLRENQKFQFKGETFSLVPSFFDSTQKLDWKKNSSKVKRTLILFFSNLQKSQIKKNVRNNNYCFSYRERWFDVDADDEDEKEWPLFSLYFNPENHLLNRPIPVYKNRFIGWAQSSDPSSQNIKFAIRSSSLEKRIETWVSLSMLKEKTQLGCFVSLNQQKMNLAKPLNFCSGPAVIRHLLNEFDSTELNLVLTQNKENMKQLYQSGNDSSDLNFDSVSEFYKGKLYLVNRNKKLKTQSKQNKKNWLNKLFSNAERYPRFIERERARSYKKFNLLIRHQKFVKKLIKKSSDPKFMTLTLLPVLPPDLRPIVKMDGQVAASDLNRLYQRIIYRNDRLKKLLNNSVMRHSYLMHFGLRLLQESVDNLISNGKSGVTPEKDSRGRLLKSLSDILKGKEGRFRQYLLGKRVDYSGRSVIVVGPRLKLYECGIPKEMAFELFLPFLLKNILNQKLARTIIGAKNLIKKNPALAWELLQETMETSPVLLNRAPTLHRLGIQAFKPKLIEGKAILLHPLVCSAFNADFDGDQMAVHIPLTVEARAEAWKLMLSINNLLSPATGEPLAIPSQDMVLGCYYLTTNCHERNIRAQKGSGLYFTSLMEVLKSYETKQLDLHSVIWLKWNGVIENGNDQDKPLEIRVNSYGNYQEIYPTVQKNYQRNNILINQYVSTTPGKVLFNFIVRKTFELI